MFPLQAAHETEIPKSFVSGTSHFQRDVTYSTQTFQVICDIFSLLSEFSASAASSRASSLFNSLKCSRESVSFLASLSNVRLMEDVVISRLLLFL